MFEKMKRMIADQLNADADSITEEPSFKDDLGADSLDLFATEDLEKMLTVGDVLKYLQSKGIDED